MSKKPYDFASHRNRQKDFGYYEQHFFLNPKHLRGCKLPVPLAWKTIRFRKRLFAEVANKPGVYAFAVRQENAGLPPHGYILYVGQTGAKKNEQQRTLRKRVREYHREKRTGVRQHVADFLNKWSKCLFFHYAPVDPDIADLLSIETKLNDALLPPYSVNDFSPDIRKRKSLQEKK